LENLLFDGPRSNEAVHKTIFRLSISPYTGKSLLIRRWVPVRVEEDKSIRANQVETAATSFATEKENKFAALRIVEFIDKFLAFGNIHSPIESETAVPTVSTEFVEHVKGLSVIADQDNLVIGILSNSSKHTIKNLHLAGIPRFHISIPTTSVLWNIIFWPDLFTSGQVIGKVE
jgi:hypothetical protein